MFKKRIYNIVFYKVSDADNAAKQATIFYTDGSVQTVSFERGIDACEEIVRERGIQTKDAFKEMINRDVVHAVSAKEFKENFNSYIPTEIEIIPENDNVINSAVAPVAAAAVVKDKVDKIVEDVKEDVKEDLEEAEEVVDEIINADEDIEDVQEDEDEIVAIPDDDLEEPDLEEEFEAEADSAEVAPIPVVAPEDDEEEIYRFTDDEFDDDFDYDYDYDDEEVEKEEPKKEGFFKRMWRKFKESHIGVVLTAIGLSLLLACGLYTCHSHKTLEGEVLNSNVPGLESTDIPEDTTFNQLNSNVASLNSISDVVNAHYYNDAAIKALLDRTSNQTQKTAMSNVGLAMDGFNNNFATYYVEDGIDVRPALTFDETVSLQVAYNDYNREQLLAIFNGADIRSEDLTRQYKDASLQLMGAYAIENSEHPVDMSMLIDSQEGRDFYNRYHTAFLAAKNAEGEEQVRLVTEFYNMVHEDFAINEDERTEGISHSSNYNRIQPYQLSVAPMIAAGEMMWQNLDIDVTLNDTEIDFLNDLGLCNFAEHSFERAEVAVMSHDVDTNNPTYQEYRDAFINYYKGLGTYYVDDAHRELTKLDSFQRAVNWHFEMGGWVYEGGSYTTTETHTETYSWEDSQTTYSEEVTYTEKPIIDEARAEVDAEIEAENEEARRRAEAEAEAERQRLQEEEDRHAAEVEEEVRQDDEDLQERIDEANDVIDDGGTVNEDDLGHGVDFDDEHSDENGNLDPSVEDITTDPTGDMTDQPLPDPNVTGELFDELAEPVYDSAPVVEPQSFVEIEEPVYNDDNAQWVESVPVADDYYYEDAWVEYEDAVDTYVESMADDSTYGQELEAEDIESYQYQR